MRALKNIETSRAVIGEEVKQGLDARLRRVPRSVETPPEPASTRELRVTWTWEQALGRSLQVLAGEEELMGKPGKERKKEKFR